MIKLCFSNENSRCHQHRLLLLVLGITVAVRSVRSQVAAIMSHYTTLFCTKKKIIPWYNLHGWSSRYISRNILYFRGKREWCHYVTGDIITATWDRTPSCLRPYGRNEKTQMVENDKRRNQIRLRPTPTRYSLKKLAAKNTVFLVKFVPCRCRSQP